MKTQTKLAEEIARAAHEGQTRRDGVTPYIQHVSRVAYKLLSEGAAPEVVAAAWLHDVLEDSHETGVSLVKKGVSVDIINIVLRLTHVKSEMYESYIRGVMNDERARRIKLNDIFDNLNDSPSERQIRKYAKALLILVPERA